MRPRPRPTAAPRARVWHPGVRQQRRISAGSSSLCVSRSRRGRRASSGRRARLPAAAVRDSGRRRVARRLSSALRAGPLSPTPRSRAAVRRAPSQERAAPIGDHGVCGSSVLAVGSKTRTSPRAARAAWVSLTTSLLIEVDRTGPSHSSSAGTTTPRRLARLRRADDHHRGARLRGDHRAVMHTERHAPCLGAANTQHRKLTARGKPRSTRPLWWRRTRSAMSSTAVASATINAQQPQDSRWRTAKNAHSHGRCY